MTDLAPTTATRDEAERLTERIRLTATNYVEARDKLEALLREAQDRAVHEALGFASWTAYLAATFADQPMVLPTAERREIVGLLAAEGMSTRDMAAIVGADHSTVSRDRKVLQTATPAVAVDTTTGEITETAGAVPEPTATETSAAPAKITGHDGKTYTRQPQRAPKDVARRPPLTEQARTAGWDLHRVVARVARIAEDDRLSRNKDEVAAQMRSHLVHAVKVCQDLLDRIDNNH